MASGYTTNYGLCQWQPEDKFIREEFNQDNQRIDTALARTEFGMRTNAYHCYNLLLQSYYDGKSTQFKKALVFDGFRDGSLIAELSQGVFRGTADLRLSSAVQPDIVFSDTNQEHSAYYSLQTMPYQVRGSVQICGIKVMLRQYANQDEWAQATFEIYVDRIKAAERTLALHFTATRQEQTVTLPTTTAYVGAEVYIRVTCPSINCHFGADIEQDYLSGTILVTPIGAQTGTMHTPVLELPDRRELRVWVRHQGGTVVMAAMEGENRHDLIPTEVRETVNLDGDTCTERSFALTEGLPVSGPLSFVLDLDLQGEEKMRVFDYGIMLL